MGSISAYRNQLHLVMLPYPAQGHVSPMMTLAKLFHSRGFFITFVNTEFNHRRLIRSKGPESVKSLPGFQFETIPDGMPPSDEDSTQDIPMLCYSTKTTCLEPFKKLLMKLNSVSGQPPVSCVVIDGVMSFGLQAARELGIPDVVLWTASACALVGYLHYVELIERGIVPFKNENFLTDGSLEASIDWIDGLPNIRLKDIPSFIRTTDINDIMLNYLVHEPHNDLKARAIIFNTIDELEHEALNAIKTNFNSPNIYTIGSLSLLEKLVPESPVKSLNSSLWKPDSTVFDWLDKQEPESVIYINYGSITTMTTAHLQEFAWGLADSRHPFLWVVRSDIVKGESAILADGFLENVKGRGLLTNWCAQDRVLAHRAVGVFLTHCGWNSMLETICNGVPVICWPFFADQQTNCWFSCTKWGIGMEINSDVKRDEVEGLVKEMMDGVKGAKMKKKALEWKRMSEDAVNVGGSSYCNFEKIVDQIRNY